MLLLPKALVSHGSVWTPFRITSVSWNRFLSCSPRYINDRLVLRGLDIHPALQGNYWAPEVCVETPISLDLDLYPYDVVLPARDDNIDCATSYADIAAQIRSVALSRRWASLTQLGSALARSSFNLARTNSHNKPITIPTHIDMSVNHRHTVLGAPQAGVRFKFAHDIYSPTRTTIFVQNLQFDTIIGILPPERIHPQPVQVNFSATLISPVTDPSIFLRRSVDIIKENIISSKAGLVETVAHTTAGSLLKIPEFNSVSLEIRKPAAVSLAESTGIKVTRCRNSSSDPQRLPSSDNARISDLHPGSELLTTLGKPFSKELPHTAILAFGSNVGDRVTNIMSALKMVEDDSLRHAKVLDTSFLYESDPMYVEDQNRFINGVCKIATSLSPLELLSRLKQIEVSLGRDLKAMVNGPREIDLDILFYDSETVTEDSLIVPHKLMLEREFVLRPLADILPHYKHPSHSKTVSISFESLMDNQKISTVKKVIPIFNPKSITQVLQLDVNGPTQIMSILNVTPDSFSDGGEALTVEAAVAKAQKHVDEGANIIDIGGMSTRPNAEDVSEQAEIDRVVPVIQGIRHAGINVPISIDTFRSAVAREAIQAGANIVNDVSAGSLDTAMLATCAKLGVPIILMHMRGDPKTMNSLTSYEDGDVVTGVRQELRKRVDEALLAGIPKWNIILDPGIGFAKDVQGNIALLANLSKVFSPTMEFSSSSLPSDLAGFPLLVGASRKRFLGALTGHQEAKQRDYATAAVTMAAIAGGARIIRVHEVLGNVDVARVAAALNGQRS